MATVRRASAVGLRGSTAMTSTPIRPPTRASTMRS